MDVLIFRVFILALIINLPTGGFSASKSRFTNIACESYGLDFAEFKSCRLKLIGRGVVGINMHIRLLKVPIYNVTVSFSFQNTIRNVYNISLISFSDQLELLASL